VRGCRLREAAVRFFFRCVDQVRKLDCILDEKHRNVVAYQIPVSFGRIKLDREAADIARDIAGAFVADDG